MSKSTPRRRLPAALALATIALTAFTGPAGAAHRTSERLVVRGEDTVKDGPCAAGVCQLELTDGAFRGTPVGTGAYSGSVKLRVAEAFENGEGGVCAPIAGRLVLGEGSSDRLVLGLSGDSCQDGAGDVTTASFTGVAHFTVKYGTGVYARASGSGLLNSFEDAADREHMTLIGRISR